MAGHGGKPCAGGTSAQTVEAINVIYIAGASDGRFSPLGDDEFDGDQATVAGAHAYRMIKTASVRRQMAIGICAPS